MNHLQNSPDRVIQHFADEIDWPALKGLRNQIDHHYLNVEPKKIWQFATENTEDLDIALRKILRKRFGQK